MDYLEANTTKMKLLAMTTLDELTTDFATEKILAVRRQISRLLASDFPHSDSKSALGLLDLVYKADLSRITEALDSEDKRLRTRVCSNLNFNIARFQHILGFILRSTNVRNSFEIYDPLLRLSKQLLGSNAKLVLSSEWDYTPFTYPATFKELPNYVFIGSPAIEAGNALIVPLAGHELGHSVWRNTGIGNDFYPQIQTVVLDLFRQNKTRFSDLWSTLAMEQIETNLFARSIWIETFKIASRQCEEIFCDALGVRIFGEAFLFAFMYLISPNPGGCRSYNYPKLSDRVRFLVKTATWLNHQIGTEFRDQFTEEEPQRPEKFQFMVDIADEAARSLEDDIIKIAKDTCDAADISQPTDKERDRILSNFSIVCPAHDPGSFADIINAGWRIRTGLADFKNKQFSMEGKLEVLNDLIFKSIEVVELRQRMRGAFDDA